METILNEKSNQKAVNANALILFLTQGQSKAWNVSEKKVCDSQRWQVPKSISYKGKKVCGLDISNRTETLQNIMKKRSLIQKSFFFKYKKKVGLSCAKLRFSCASQLSFDWLKKSEN